RRRGLPQPRQGARIRREEERGQGGRAAGAGQGRQEARGREEDPRTLRLLPQNAGLPRGWHLEQVRPAGINLMVPTAETTAPELSPRSDRPGFPTPEPCA